MWQGRARYALFGLQFLSFVWLIRSVAPLSAALGSAQVICFVSNLAFLPLFRSLTIVAQIVNGCQTIDSHFFRKFLLTQKLRSDISLSSALPRET